MGVDLHTAEQNEIAVPHSDPCCHPTPNTTLKSSPQAPIAYTEPPQGPLRNLQQRDARLTLLCQNQSNSKRILSHSRS